MDDVPRSRGVAASFSLCLCVGMCVLCMVAEKPNLRSAMVSRGDRRHHHWAERRRLKMEAWTKKSRMVASSISGDGRRTMSSFVQCTRGSWLPSFSAKWQTVDDFLQASAACDGTRSGGRKGREDWSEEGKGAAMGLEWGELGKGKWIRDWDMGWDDGFD